MPLPGTVISTYWPAQNFSGCRSRFRAGNVVGERDDGRQPCREVLDRDRPGQQVFVIVQQFDFDIAVSQRPAQQYMVGVTIHFG